MNIKILNPANNLEMHSDGDALRDPEGNVIPLSGGVYRFVRDDNYTANFGFQWNKFAKTQIDRYQQNSKQSYERFFKVTRWDQQDLTGQNVLEVGSGAGRFSQIVLQHTNATLYSVDYSNAVDANFRNNGPDERLRLFQASIYELPFAPHQFDKVFCFGVLQHTPDFRKSIQCLANMVKPGGELVVDFYPVKGWYTKIHAKYLLRPLTRRMSHEQLLKWIEKNANGMIRLYNFLHRIGLGVLSRFVPICDIRSTIPPSIQGDVLREWVILDTFDMFSPTFDHPQRLSTVERWVSASGLGNVEGRVLEYGKGNTVTVVRGERL